MTIAAAIDSRTAEAPARSRASRIARVDVFRDLAQAEAIWRELEERQLATPYQRFGMLSAWQSEVGSRESSEPFIVTAHDADGRPLVLLPLVLRVRRGVRIASFMGGKHTTFNMALWDLDFAREATAADLARSVIGPPCESCRRRAGADPAAAALAGSSQSACHAAAGSARSTTARS